MVTWCGTFTLSSPRDTPEEIAESINALVGADLQRKVNPGLEARGWEFCDPIAEDYGWYAGAEIFDEGKRLVAAFITCGDLDKADPPGGALGDRWAVVVDLDIGIFARTKARRMIILRRLAADVESACLEIGAADFQWDEVMSDGRSAKP